jgi:D-alanyl-lipoteichoic acid acyltransferase DltB (MBOAT superfamily)
MLFTSTSFFFGFLPVVLLGFVIIGRSFGRLPAIAWLATASLVFYGSWGTTFLLVLLGSAVLNYFVGRSIKLLRERNSRAASFATAAGIAANVAVLGYFKYADFFIDNVNQVFLAAGWPAVPHLNVILPLGISFFTFQQIAYLADVLNGQDKKHGFIEYLLFVSFFGTVTAGPITNQSEIMPQLRSEGFRIRFDTIAAALALFSFGLFKKLVLGDALAPYANSVFAAAAGGATISTADAWLGTTAYFLQLYFDFSGYCDMALGIGTLFGLRLPLNFNSPLKATSVIDYWRRWHMTLTRFITSYLYMPAAIRLTRYCHRRGFGPITRFVVAVGLPVIMTFVLAGLWHGAGWTFVLFGLLWGAALTVNYAWREARQPELPVALGWGLTMLVALISMALFRADDLPAAGAVLGGMVGLSRGSSSLIPIATVLPMLVGLVAFLLVAPNTQQVLRNFAITSDPIDPPTVGWRTLLTWRNDAAGAAITAAVFLFAVLSAQSSSGFLYYKF